jgi:hypothetical protein
MVGFKLLPRLVRDRYCFNHVTAIAGSSSSPPIIA